MDFPIITRKRGEVLLFKEHQYYKQKVYKNLSQIWFCRNRRNSLKCSGSVTINGNHVEKTVEHKSSCKPEENQNQLALSMYKLKEVAGTSAEPMLKVYEEHTKSLKQEGLNVPAFESVKCSLYNARKQKLKVSRTAYKRLEDVEVPATFDDFLVADYQYQGTRLLLFCSNQAKEFLKTVNEYFVDATFKSTPQPFSQLLSIHGDFGSTSQTTVVIPLIHVLMSDKKESSYAAVFDILSTIFPDWQTTKFHADFERAVANALTHFFPATVIKKCYYHYCQCLWRKAKSIGINRKFDKRIVGLCTVLPLTPVEQVEQAWQYIKTEAQELSGKNIKQFVTYMIRNWLKKENITDWNVVGERHRTNNVCESWHSKLNKHINKNYVTINKLLTVLYEQREFNIATKKRRADQIAKDDYVLACQLKLLNEEISLGHFIEMLR